MSEMASNKSCANIGRRAPRACSNRPPGGARGARSAGLVLRPPRRPHDLNDNVMDNGATHSTATLLFSFLLSFLGLSCASILGGLVWQRFSARWRGHPDDHPDTLKGPPVPPSRPRMWDVCIRDTLSAAKLSDCAWEQLRASTCSPLWRAGWRNYRNALQPLALHLTSAAHSKAGVAEESRPAKWKLR